MINRPRNIYDFQRIAAIEELERQIALGEKSHGIHAEFTLEERRDWLQYMIEQGPTA